VALSIAGSDSGGGAGIQADLRAFGYFQVHGTTVITAVTAQNPGAVTGVQAVSPELVLAQLDAVLSAFSVGGIKTGMLFSAEIIAVVANRLAAQPRLPLVVDPVMVATSGARLLRDDACAVLRERLLPLATIVTPNLPEAEFLLGWPVSSLAETVMAARELASQCGATVIIKGGHRDGNSMIDVVSDGQRSWRISAPRLAVPSTHGTGCSLSAAMAAQLALGQTPLEAIIAARRYVQSSLAACVQVGETTWSMAVPNSQDHPEIVCEPW
jgi:hydroxymethylpyrimidine/phosphomethylpyrimidine kinase